MPSADFRPITHRIAPVRPAGIAVGTGGHSTPFSVGPSRDRPCLKLVVVINPVDTLLLM